MPRKFNRNKNRRENLLKRKRTHITNSNKLVDNNVELSINQLNSKFGAQSLRGKSFAPTQRGRRPIPKEVSDIYETYNDFGSRTTTRDPNPTDTCTWLCNGEEVDVFPGTCIRCPEAAFCPDDVVCEGPGHPSNQSSIIDTGWACCGCSSSNWEDGNGIDYAKKLGSHYITYLGDFYCDDGAEFSDTDTTADFFTQMHLGCTRLNSEYGCRPTNQLAINAISNNYLNGPDDNLDIFPWSANQGITQFEIGPMAGAGKVPIHYTCKEWGWDCGGFAHDYFNLGDGACLGKYNNIESDLMDTLGITSYDVLTSYDWLTEANDPYLHCNYKKGLSATCKGKCNRDEYINGDLGYDPGAFAKVTQGGANIPASVCFCDESCAWCGCDYNLLGSSLYQECIQNCPGEPDYKCHDPAEPGYENQIPGITCNRGSYYPGGDCCGDYVQWCEIPPLEFPCECYDVGNTLSWIDYITTGDCQLGPNAGGDSPDQCIYSELLETTSSDSDCEIACENECNSQAVDVNANNWLNSIEGTGNLYCTMWDFNYNLAGKDRYNQNYWAYIPYCEVDYYMHEWDSSDNSCHCECSDCRQQPEDYAINEYDNVPKIGCGGVGGFMENGVVMEDGVITGGAQEITAACNYGVGNNADVNCSKEWILTQNNNYWNEASVEMYGECVFGSVHYEESRSPIHLPIYKNGKTQEIDTDTEWSDSYYNDMWLSKGGSIIDLLRGCAGCPDPYAANYTGMKTYITPGEWNSIPGNSGGQGYDLGYGQVEGAPIGYAIDWNGNKCTTPFTSAGTTATECDVSGCVYEYGCPDSDNYLNPNGMCCGGENDTGDGYECSNGTCQETAECGEYAYCKSIFGCLTSNPTDGCCANEISYGCGDPLACNYSDGCVAGIDNDGWFGTINSQCIIDNSVCTYPTLYCSDCDGDGLRDFYDNPGNCGDDLSNTNDGNGPWNVCTEYTTGDNQIIASTCDGVEGGCLSYVPPNGGNGFPAVPCAPEDDFFSNCPTNMTHGNIANGENPCTAEEFQNQCCLPTGCCDPTNPEDERPASCDGDYVLGYDDGVNYDHLDRPNGFLYCCRQEDDCGQCVADGQGYYEISQTYVYVIGQGCLDDGELTEGSGSDPLCQCPSGTYNIPTYENVATGELYCSCPTDDGAPGGQILDCTCTYDIENSCGTGNVTVCGECGDIDSGDYDYCGVCDGFPGYDPDYVPVECESYASGDGPTVGLGCSCPNDAGIIDVCDCAGNCVPPGSEALVITYYGDHDGDGCCVETDSHTKCEDQTASTNYYTEDVCMSGCGGQWDIDDANDCPANIIDECGNCEGIAYEEQCIGNDSCMPFMDCNGVCNGDAYIDDCGICGGNNESMDDCGICSNRINEYQIKNSIGDIVNITYGSFGCRNRRWFDSNFDFSENGTCEVEHCGCQCAGCTNIFSPSYTERAKYSVECTEVEKSAGVCQSWFCDTVEYQDGNEPNAFCPTDYCEDEQAWAAANNRWEIKKEYGLLYCNDGDESCINNQDWILSCVDDTGELIPGSYCIDGVIPCPDGTYNGCLNSTLSDGAYDVWKAHGGPDLNDSGYYFHYCSNTTTANEGCDDWQNSTVAQECINIHGDYCCGIALGYEHCRVGERSDLFWNIARSQNEGNPDFDFDDWFEEWINNNQPDGDFNQDGTVNVLDIISIINLIVGGTTINANSFDLYISDINQDGIVNILDVVILVNSILARASRNGRSNQSKLRTSQEAKLIQYLKPIFGNSITQQMFITDTSNIMNTPKTQYMVSLNNYINSIRRYKYRYRSRNNTRTNDYQVQSMKFIFNAPTCIPADVPIEIGDTFNVTLNGIDDWSTTNILTTEGDNLFAMSMTDAGYSAGIDIGDIASHLLTIYWPNVHFQAAAGDLYSHTEGFNLIKHDVSDLIANGCTIDNPVRCEENAACYDSGEIDGTDDLTCLANFELQGILGSDMNRFYESEVYCPAGGCVDNKYYWTYKERNCN